MKNKVRRIAAIVCMSIMLCGMSMGVCAAVHVCAYSYMGDTVTSPSTVVGSHPYTRYNGQTYETVTCYISSETHADVYKCACRAMEYRNAVTYTHHSLCGL